MSDDRWLLDSTVVTAKVSEDGTSFTTHKGLLCKYASYFKSAYNTGMKEA